MTPVTDLSAVDRLLQSVAIAHEEELRGNRVCNPSDDHHISLPASISCAQFSHINDRHDIGGGFRELAHIDIKMHQFIPLRLTKNIFGSIPNGIYASKIGCGVELGVRRRRQRHVRQRG